MLGRCGTGQSTGTLANPADPIKACGSSGEEISPFRRAWIQSGRLVAPVIENDGTF